MKIIAGISNAHKPEEIAGYAEAGVDEFFVGFVPHEWSLEYGWELSPNRRETSNYQYRKLENLENVVRLIHDQGRKVFLALNAHDYNLKQIKLLVEIMKKIRHIEFDGFIVSNLAIILALRNEGFEDEINISIGAGTNNIETIQFFKNNFENIGRFILPRKLTMSEIDEICTFGRENNIRLEAFGLAEGCYFNDEFCFTWHGEENKCFCKSPMFEFRQTKPLYFGTNWKKEIENPDLNQIFQKKIETESWIEKERQEYRRTLSDRPQGFNSKEVLHILANIHKCGLCAFKNFKTWGIEAVKLPLRGHGFKMNLELVQLARQIIDHPNATPKVCQALLKSPGFCSGENCYYDYPYSK